MNWKQLQIFLLAGSTSPASEILKAAECRILYIYRKKQEFHYLELFTHHKIAELVSSIPVGESTHSGWEFYALWMGQHLLLSEFTRVQTTQNISEQEKKKTEISLLRCLTIRILEVPPRLLQFSRINPINSE